MSNVDVVYHNGQRQKLKAQFWLHLENLNTTLEAALDRFLARDPNNEVLETHNDCACIGAKDPNVPDTHTLVAVWETP